MKTRYSYQLNFYSHDLLLINFDGFNDQYHGTNQHGKSTTAVKAMEDVLIKQLNLKINDDYDLAKSGYGSDNLASIRIKRPANIIIVLNYLLANALTNSNSEFQLHPSLMQSIYAKNPMQECLGEASFKFMNMIASFIESKTMSTADIEKAFPVIRANLDALYHALLLEDLVKRINIKPHETSALLCHPFYQTLSILLDDHNQREIDHNKKGFLHMTGRKNIDEKPYLDIYNKYKFYVPNCYCNNIEDPLRKTLNADKLRLSTNQNLSASFKMTS